MKTKEPVVRVPVDLLGRVLGHGKASVYAAHLLIIKLARNVVLNERDVDRKYAIGRRAFRAGLAVLKRQGILERRQDGRRTYATETLAASDSARFVQFPRVLLTEDSKVVAIVAAILLSPGPRRLEDICERVGITSSTTRAALLKKLAHIDAIAIRRGVAGRAFVGRRDCDFTQASKNVPTKNVPTKNVPAHSSWTEVNLNEKTSISNGKYTHITPRSREGAVRDVLIDLADWKAGVPEDVRPEMWRVDPATVTVEMWKKALADMGVEAPAHVQTPEAVQQIKEIVGYFVAEEPDADDWDVLRELAYRVGKAHAKRQVIRSFGLIVTPLAYQRIHSGIPWGRAPLVLHPSYDSGEDLAYEALARAEHLMLSVNRERLLRPFEINELAKMYASYGRSPILSALVNVRPEEGKYVMRWAFWNDAAREIAAQKERDRVREAERLERQRTRRPRYRPSKALAGLPRY